MADGRIIYQGPASEAVPYFKTIDLVCPSNNNPADYFMKEFSIPFDMTDEVWEKIDKINTSYEDVILPRILEAGDNVEVTGDFKSTINRRAGFCKQLYYLNHRNVLQLIRNP